MRSRADEPHALNDGAKNKICSNCAHAGVNLASLLVVLMLCTQQGNDAGEKQALTPCL